RKDDFKDSTPPYQVSSSPIVVNGLCIAQFGGEKGGGIVAFDLASGDEKWKWTGDGAAYASPSLLSGGDTRAIVAETAKKVVAIGLDGKLLWETPFVVAGKGRGYNAASPMVANQTVLISGSGRGIKAVKFEQNDDKLTPKELWSNAETSTQFNTPV